MIAGALLSLGGLKVFLCEHLEIFHVCSPVKKKKAGKRSLFLLDKLGRERMREKEK